ncbi:hypothetical protein RHMOL_Rhmol05G0060700 [Rhododendron molle]|uniref:Uncharacterized protein n=1 Tax=Rhododendron molle TaxID=49168 RepID=A0ACC0NN20_RHOML|nr:hypothetical protein RHMOL_Rhmol05G0060700 [Rhododendron molle]
MFLRTRDEQVAAEQEVNGDCFAEDEPPRKRGARATTLDMHRQLTQLRELKASLSLEQKTLAFWRKTHSFNRARLPSFRRYIRCRALLLIS